MIIKGQMTYDQHGRRRKSKFTKAVKTKQPEWKTPMSQYSTPQDNSYKQKESKNYTVSIAYNKGAYQVIPKEEIKHIGK
jgi:hypothetical protein